MGEAKHDIETNGQNEKKNYDTLNRQIIASISWFLVTLCVGMSYAFTGTLLSIISPEYITEDEGSWLVATNTFSMVIGALLSTISARAIGYKSSVLIGNLIWICGWACLSLAATLHLFLVACFLIGFSAGFGSKVAMVYLVEMPQRELRGIFSVINSTCSMFGVMLGHLVSITPLDWRSAMQLCALVPTTSLIFLIFAAELPNWLLLKGQLEKAKENFFWLRGATPETEAEFTSMVTREKEIIARNLSTYRTIFSRTFMIPFFVSATLFSTQSFSGYDSLVVYAATMLKKMSQKINANLVTIAFDAVSVICGIISCYLIKQFNRRVLILSGAGGTIVSLILIISAIHFELPVPVLTLCLCIFSACVNLGVIPVVWLLPAEIFPEINRDLGVSVSTTYYDLFTAILAKVIPFLTGTWGMQITLSILTTAFCICTILIFFFMPETKKLTLPELELEFMRGNSVKPEVNQEAGTENGFH